MPDLAGSVRLDHLARRANGDAVVEIPVGIGCCLYIRRDCLDSVGLLRDDVFAQGYGEENDFCLRARHLGWRHVALPGLFVAHRGGTSFGGVGSHLRARNEAILNQLHPGYDRLVAAFLAADPLQQARRRLDLARWRQGRRKGQKAAILITHDEGGGVERRIRAAAAAHRAAGLRPIVLRPAKGGDNAPALRLDDLSDMAGPVSPYADDAACTDERAPEPRRSPFSNLVFRLPDELPILLRLLRAERPAIAEAHHFLGHHPAVWQLVTSLGVPYRVHVHDYTWLCPRVALVDGRNRYCGEPAPASCDYCVADHGRFITEDISTAELRARSLGFLRRARRVVTPSGDAAKRIARHFFGIAPHVSPFEDDAALPPNTHHHGSRIVCVPGAIGIHKGFEVLLACARDAAARSLDLSFVVVGVTIDDSRLMQTNKVFVTGRYAPEEAVSLIKAQRAALGFLPLIAPETWCFALTELWRPGSLSRHSTSERRRSGFVRQDEVFCYHRMQRPVL